MVSVPVSSLGCTELIFIDPGVKINGAYYRDVLLGEHLLPAIKELLGSEFFIFQQNSAPAHWSRETVDLLSTEITDFISPTLWPPNSPDLDPVDYKIWSILQERVYQTHICDADHLKQQLVEEWNCFDQGIVQSMNDKIALEHVFELMMGILNSSFEKQYLTRINFSCFCRIVKFNKK